MADRKIRYVIETLWKGRDATSQARRDIETVGKAGKEAKEGVDAFGASLDKLKQAAAFLGIGIGLNELRQFVMASITAASDVEEQFAKFEAVFEDLAGGVQQQLEAMAEATGQSRYQLISFASTLQDTFVPLGFAREQAAEFSTTLVQLALDMASFDNIDPAKVVMDLQSAVVGNTETLRKYGVVATQAAIETYALENAIWDGVGAITAQEKAAAILGITLDSTTDAQGNAAREAGNYASRVRAVEAAALDAQIAIGQKLLPAATDTADVMATELIPALEDLAVALIELGEAEEQLGLAGGLSTLASGIETLADNLEQMKQWGQVLSAMSAPTQAVTSAWTGMLGALARGETVLNQVRDSSASTGEKIGILVNEFALVVPRTQMFVLEMLGLDDAARQVNRTLVQTGMITGGLFQGSMIPEGAKGMKEAATQVRSYAEALEDLRAKRSGRRDSDVGLMGNLGLDVGQLREFAAGLQLVEERARIMAERGLAVAAGSAVQLREALMESRVSMGEGFLEFFDTDLLQKQFGEYVTYAVDNSKRIVEIEEALQGDLTKAQAEAYKEREKLIEERSKEAERLRARLREDLTADERDELLAELRELQEAQGELRQAWVVDEDMAAFAGVMLESAAGAGAAGKALLELAGNTDAARDALTQAAFREKADELGKAVADGAITAKDAMQQLADFMDGFDLDAVLAQEANLGAESFGEKAKRDMLALVEGIDTTARQTAQGGRNAIKEVRDDLEDLTGPWPYEIDNQAATDAVTAIKSVRDALLELDGTIAKVGVEVSAPAGLPGLPVPPPGIPGLPSGTPLPPASGGGGGMTDVGAQSVPGFGPVPAGGGQTIIVNHITVVSSNPWSNPMTVGNAIASQINQYAMGAK